METNYGRKYSKEWREKISKALKGKYAGDKASFFGKVHSDDTKKRMKQAAILVWAKRKKTSNETSINN